MSIKMGNLLEIIASLNADVESVEGETLTALDDYTFKTENSPLVLSSLEVSIDGDSVSGYSVNWGLGTLKFDKDMSGEDIIADYAYYKLSETDPVNESVTELLNVMENMDEQLGQSLGTITMDGVYRSTRNTPLLEDEVIEWDGDETSVKSSIIDPTDGKEVLLSVESATNKEMTVVLEQRDLNSRDVEYYDEDDNKYTYSVGKDIEDWEEDTSYSKGDFVVNEGKIFLCTESHESDSDEESDNEPYAGENWENYWYVPSIVGKKIIGPLRGWPQFAGGRVKFIADSVPFAGSEVIVHVQEL